MIHNLIKRAALAALLAVLATAQAAAQFTDQRVWGGTSGGTANAKTLTIPNMSTYLTGVPIRFNPGSTNTNATTIAVNGLSARNIFKPTAGGAQALTGGEIIAGQIVEIVYDGTQFQITSNTNAAATQVKAQPQGYLTPCPSSSPPTGCTAGNVVPTGDVTVGVGQPVTGIVYTPNVGNQIPIWNGSNMVVSTFTELTLTLTSSHLANTIYDVYVFNDAGTLRIGTGPAWTSSTPGSGNRGSGGGTAQVTRLQGLTVNAVAIPSMLNGANTYNVAANFGTYVGSILVSSSNGVLSFTKTYGQNRMWGAWNAYNRLPIYLSVGDSTSSWSYNSNTIRAANGNSANRAIVFSGLPEENVSANYSVNFVTSGISGQAAIMQAGIGLNSTTAYSGKVGNGGGSVGASWDIRGTLYSNFNLPAFIGVNNVQMLENVPPSGGSATTQTYNGTSSENLMSVWYRG